MTARDATRVLIQGADAALHGLLEEWLSALGCRVVEERPDLILVDLPRSRQAAADILQRLRSAHAGVPLMALSSNLFARVETNGAVARELAVDAVLAKPLTREALVRALGALLPQPE